MASVVIPAHNEARVIARCLRSVLDQSMPSDEIVVVCNGCSDDTAEVARGVDERVRVEEISEASKIAALNRGDELVSSFPRLYVDADVELGPGVLPALVEALDEPPLELASPGVRFDLTDSSWVVRAYYRIWSQLPSVRDDTVGRGVYALSAAGRSRFDAFPDVMGDDHFVRDHIDPSRRGIVGEVWSTVRAPRSLAGVMRRRIRVATALRQLDTATPVSRRRARGRQREWLGVVRRDPRLVPIAPLYVMVAVWPRVVVLARRLRHARPRWDRDETSRTE